MEILITERYKLKSCDELNMQLYEFRAVETDRSHRYASEPRKEWRGTGNYFQDVKSALLFVRKRLQREDDFSGDLPEAIKRLEVMDKRMIERLEQITESLRSVR